MVDEWTNSTMQVEGIAVGCDRGWHSKGSWEGRILNRDQRQTNLEAKAWIRDLI